MQVTEPSFAFDRTFGEVVHLLMVAIEMTGVAVIVIGSLVALLAFARRLPADAGDAYEQLRSNLGRAILLGLELLVAADIIGTVAVEPTLEGVVVLGIIVLIRTFLSFSLEVEINGHWPWQGAALRNDRRRRVADEEGRGAS